jgi:oxygen-independent coproporphyrinogen-3 oxidase
MNGYVDALLEELRQKALSHPGNLLETLYLGGGTPSLLSRTQLERIVDHIHRYYSFQQDPEWTIECNPDDLDQKKIKELRKAGFNRLSIGIQSFHEKDLVLMRRSHNADQAAKVVLKARAGGFDNISMDLIYGIPGQTLAEWEENVDKALSLPLSHLSAYHLTFEPGTVFDHWRKKGKIQTAPEEESVEQYRLLREKMLSAGFVHYELSNFGRGALVSRHNMLYWSGFPYLGLGTSAHSFDGEQRSWNISSLKGYMAGIKNGERIQEQEQLSDKEKYHDYLISSLRTARGADPEYVEEKFGKAFRIHLEKQAAFFISAGSMSVSSGRLQIDPGQWLITDHILRALFMD